MIQFQALIPKNYDRVNKIIQVKDSIPCQGPRVCVPLAMFKLWLPLRGEKGIVGVEDHEGVVIGVAAEEERTRVSVEWVGNEPHWASHSGDHHLMMK